MLGNAQIPKYKYFTVNPKGMTNTKENNEENLTSSVMHM